MNFKHVPSPGLVPRWDVRLAHKPQPNRKKRDYQKHLASAYWKRLRKHRFSLDSYQCQVRVGFSICGEPAEELAHLTYDRFGEERIEDVQSQCAAHNQLEREQRIARGVLG